MQTQAEIDRIIATAGAPSVHAVTPKPSGKPRMTRKRKAMLAMRPDPYRDNAPPPPPKAAKGKRKAVTIEVPCTVEQMLIDTRAQAETPSACAPHITREAWLNDVTARLHSLFAKAGATIPVKVRVAVAFPSTGRKGKRIGECWDATASGDGTFEIMLRPDLADPMRVAGVLAHELVHASVGLTVKHGKEFKAVATAIGLEGKMTATTEGDAFKLAVQPILDAVGPLPHAVLRFGGLTSGPKKQVARMIKCKCVTCGYVARTTRSWIETVGPPHCPDHGVMEVC